MNDLKPEPKKYKTSWGGLLLIILVILISLLLIASSMGKSFSHQFF